MKKILKTVFNSLFWDWDELETSDKVFFMIAFGGALLVFVVIMWRMGTPSWREVADCSEFGNLTIQQMPVRCIEYWKGER